MGRSWVTFALDSDGNVRGLEFEGMGTFNRKPEPSGTASAPAPR